MVERTAGVPYTAAGDGRREGTPKNCSTPFLVTCFPATGATYDILFQLAMATIAGVSLLVDTCSQIVW